MKLPRWLVWSMLSLSVVAALAGAGWWWVTWPERTACYFLDPIANGRTDSAEAMLADEHSSQLGVDLTELRLPKNDSKAPTRRSSLDMIQGRRQFYFRAASPNDPNNRGIFMLSIERAEVTDVHLFMI